MPRDKARHAVACKANRARYIDRNRNTVWKYLLAHPCIDCGENDPVVLEFDHTNGAEKTKTVAALVHRACSTDTLLAEIRKCVVRCANCHRRKTAAELGWFRAYVDT